MQNFLVACFAVLLLSSCATPISHYQNETPALKLEEYFDGELQAWGTIENFSGEVTRRFTVRIVGKRDGDKLVLDEYFQFDDGEKQFRQWRIEKTGAGRYVGRADDVIGSATGESAGNALHWRYTLRVPVDDTTYDLHFDDWMFLIDQQHMINKAEMRKFGVTVGEVTLFFRKQSQPHPASVP